MAWQQGAPGLLELQNPAVFGLDGKIYAAGGMTYGGVRSAALQIYDPETNRWSRGADLPTALANTRSPSITGLRGSLYLFGGFSLQTNRYVATMYRYDISSNQWSLVNTLEGFGRSGCGMAPVGDIIYIFSGVNDSGGEGRNPEKDVLTYNTISNTGTLLREIMPTGRAYQGMAVVDGKIYLIAGDTLVGEYEAGYGYYITNTRTTRSEVYDPSSNSFQTISNSLATGTTYATQYSDEIYAMNGNALMIYNPADNSWRFGEAASSHSAGSLDAIGNFLYSASSVISNPIVFLDLRTAEIVNMSPAAGFLDERVNNTFSWQISSNASTVQESAIFQWRVTGTTATYDTAITGSSTYVTIPAGTFPDGSFQWRVSAVTADGVETGWSAWATITTQDVPHTKPTNLYPNSGSRNANASIELSWVVNSPLSTPQSAFEVQVAYDGYTWENLSGKVESSQSTYLIPENTLAPGENNQVYWRVVTYNTDDLVGEWSDPVSFLAIPAPDPARWVSIESGTPRPLARWLASDQEAYQLRVLRGDQVVYDTGWTPGAATEHRVSNFLQNGTHTFQVRYRNMFSLESDWAATEALIQFRPNLDIRLTGTLTDNAIQLEFTVRPR